MALKYCSGPLIYDSCPSISINLVNVDFGVMRIPPFSWAFIALFYDRMEMKFVIFNSYCHREYLSAAK